MEPKSKSQRKREMMALQAMGRQLVELTPHQIEKIEMPQELREALLFAKTLKRSEALRRQLKYIGALMRDIDLEPISKALELISRGQRQDAKLFRRLEWWRDGLVGGNDELLEEILNDFPDTDRQRLRQLVLNARKEKEQDKPSKATRALFRH